MSVEQKGERKEVGVDVYQTVKEGSDEFRNEQERLLNSGDKHLQKACAAGMIAGGGTAMGGLIVGTGGLIVGGVIALEMFHQLGAAVVDLGKHKLNDRKHYISVKNTPVGT